MKKSIIGTFRLEGRTRFVAYVETGGELVRCYVPMSTKLSRYFDPIGKKVRLEEQGGRLWIEQVKLHGKWVWVNAAKAVELLKRKLEKEGKIVESEKMVERYRFDLWCEGVGYEVKSVLSDQKVVRYPNANSIRRDRQLQVIRKLLKKGLKLVWSFVVLSDSKFELDLNTSFGRALTRSQRAGLCVQVWQYERGRIVKDEDCRA